MSTQYSQSGEPPLKVPRLSSSNRSSSSFPVTGHDAWHQLVFIENELDKYNEKFYAEQEALAIKYEEFKKPLYMKRQSLISNIPRFWSTALENHPDIGPLLTYMDCKILNYLNNIEVSRDSSKSFKIILMFSENPYFQENEIVKIVTVDERGEFKVDVSNLNWKKEKNQDLKVSPTTRSSESHVNEKTLPIDSCFLSTFLGDDVALAQFIVDDVFPNAFSYFRGEIGGNDSDDDDNPPTSSDEEEKEEPEHQDS